jgi:hypothetical protein
MNAKIEEIGYSGEVTNESGHEAIQSMLPTAAPSPEEPPRRPRRR